MNADKKFVCSFYDKTQLTIRVRERRFSYAESPSVIKNLNFYFIYYAMSLILSSIIQL